jgi:hypothetical protein
MFYYPGWLQTSSPLFLLLERGAVRVLGLSTVSTRVIPLALELAAVGFLFAAARRVTSLPVATLATTLVAFHPVAIEYSRTAKQYSGEMAATAALLAVSFAYLNRPTRRSFSWLVVTVLVALPLAYSAVFLVPGIVVAVALAGERRRSVWLTLAACGVFAGLYPLFIAPNYSPVLREFWAADAEPVWSLLGLGGILLAGAVLAAAGRRMELIVCGLPILLLTIAAALKWYPASPRTALFILPCIGLLAAMLLDGILRSWPRPAVLVKIALWIAIGVVPTLAAWRQVREHRNLPEEDFAGALQYLKLHAAASDLLLVHPSLKEGFELYAAMEHFSAPAAVYGSTGWPCCVRGHLDGLHSSSRQAVIGDLRAKIPKHFSGRVWLLYATRPTQWDYVGLDEGNLWRSRVWAMGCPPEEFVSLAGIAFSPMVCGGK